MGGGEEGSGVGPLGRQAVPVHLQPAGVRSELGVLHPSAAGLRGPAPLLAPQQSEPVEDGRPSAGPLSRASTTGNSVKPWTRPASVSTVQASCCCWWWCVACRRGECFASTHVPVLLSEHWSRVSIFLLVTNSVAKTIRLTKQTSSDWIHEHDDELIASPSHTHTHVTLYYITHHMSADIKC